MKTKDQLEEEILKTTAAYGHVLDTPCATIHENAPHALLQLEGCARLETLYWILGKKRPRFKCDRKVRS